MLPRTWSKLAYVSHELSGFWSSLSGAGRSTTIDDAKRAVEELVLTPLQGLRGTERRIRDLVYPNRKGWHTVQKRRSEFAPAKSLAWYVLLLVKLGIVSHGAALRLKVPLQAASGRYARLSRTTFLSLRADFLRRHDGAFADRLWHRVVDLADEFHAECMTIGKEQRRIRKIGATTNQQPSGLCEEASVLDWLVRRRRIHQLDGMLFLHQRRDEIRGELDDLMARGDIDRIIPAFPHLNHQAWTLEWPELRERYYETILEALRSSAARKQQFLPYVNAEIQGRGFTPALRALVERKGLNYALEKPSAIGTAADEWQALLEESREYVKSPEEKRLYLESVASLCRVRGMLAAATDLQKAEDEFQRGMRCAQEARIESQYLALARELSWVWRQNGRHREAQRLIHESLTLAVRQGNERRAIQLRLELAEILLEMGHVSQAEIWHSEAEASFDYIQSIVGEEWYQPSWRWEFRRVRTRLDAGVSSDQQQGSVETRHVNRRGKKLHPGP